MTDSSDRGPLKAGDHFGDYIVERMLGKGGMGFVYLVRAPDGSRFAVKVMARGNMTHNLRSRFAHEADFAMKVRHHNMISVYDVGEDPETGLCYIIMDYMSGGSLADRIRKQGRLPVDEAVKITMQIAAALNVAHRNGLVHRDVKPDNIMFADDGTPKLADLGVAKFDDDRKTMLTMTGMIIGTPAYMSPEQLMDSHRIDARADIYSLGVVFYEMIAGERPNSGSTAVELLAKAIKGEPLPDIRKMCPEVSASIAHVLSLMCAPKPENRPDTSVEAAELLQKAAAGELVLAKSSPRSVVAISAERNSKRKRFVAVDFAAAGMLVFLVVGLVGVSYAVLHYFSSQGKQARQPIAKVAATSPAVMASANANAAREVDAAITAGGAVLSSVASSNAKISNRQTAEGRNGRKGAASRRVCQTKVGETTWYYTLRGGEAVIWRGHVGYNDATKPAFEPSDVEKVVVPAELDGYKVSSIGSYAFFRCRIKSVVIPEGVRCLGSQAFYGCRALESVTLSLSLDLIDRFVFEKCSSLTRIDIGECPYVTGSSFNCSSLARVSVAPSNHEYKEIGGSLMSRDLREMVFFPRTGRYAVFPEGVKEIGEGAFMGCKNLKSVKVPGRVKKVGMFAFAYCRNLASVEFESGVNEIGDKAFAYCPNLKKVSFPDSLASVDSLLFDRCSALQRVEFWGDAPQVDSFESLFGDAPENLQVIVKRGSKGWKTSGSTELPERWPAAAGDDSRKIRFADDYGRRSVSDVPR